jgi:hypothetical protein
MPVLVDYSNVFIASVTAFSQDFRKGESTEKMGQIARHIFLTSLLGYKKAWSEKCGSIIIACDGKANWRKDVFPYYKGMRKSKREESDTDWSSIFSIMAEVKIELAMMFPYKVLQDEKAEGDDIIFILSDYFAENDFVQDGLEESAQRVMNISSDHDFLQQYKHRNYAQWSPRVKKVIPKPPSTFLVEKIIAGDEGDGCPSVLMPDDFLMDREKYGGRAKPVTKKVIEKFSNLSNLNKEELARYKRNEVLISSEHVPVDLRARVIHQYKIAPDVCKRQEILDYTIKYRLRQLTPRVTEF